VLTLKVINNNKWEAVRKRAKLNLLKSFGTKFFCSYRLKYCWWLKEMKSGSWCLEIYFTWKPLLKGCEWREKTNKKAWTFGGQIAISIIMFSFLSLTVYTANSSDQGPLFNLCVFIGDNILLCLGSVFFNHLFLCVLKG